MKIAQCYFDAIKFMATHYPVDKSPQEEGFGRFTLPETCQEGFRSLIFNIHFWRKYMIAVDGNQKSGKLTSWGKCSLSHYLPGFLLRLFGISAINSSYDFPTKISWKSAVRSSSPRQNLCWDFGEKGNLSEKKLTAFFKSRLNVFHTFGKIKQMRIREC